MLSLFRSLQNVRAYVTVINKLRNATDFMERRLLIKHFCDRAFEEKRPNRKFLFFLIINHVMLILLFMVSENELPKVLIQGGTKLEMIYYVLFNHPRC